MWQKDTAPGPYTWQEALSYCENLNLAGYDDWRLPNRIELHSITDYSTYDPSTDPIFSIGALRSYWSSTTFAFDTSSAHGVYFYDGLGGAIPKSINKHVRAVRAGQNGSTTTTTASATICPSELIYGEHSEQTELLRNVRENVLKQTSEGRELVKLYYQWSPFVVKAMEEDKEFRQEVKGMIDSVLPMIEKIVSF